MTPTPTIQTAAAASRDEHSPKGHLITAAESQVLREALLQDLPKLTTHDEYADFARYFERQVSWSRRDWRLARRLLERISERESRETNGQLVVPHERTALVDVYLAVAKTRIVMLKDPPRTGEAKRFVERLDYLKDQAKGMLISRERAYPGTMALMAKECTDVADKLFLLEIEAVAKAIAADEGMAAPRPPKAALQGPGFRQMSMLPPPRV